MKRIELEEEIKKTDEKDVIEDLQKVAKQLQKNTITIEEYEIWGKYPYYAPKLKFGGWQKAMKAAKLKKTITYSNISNEKLIEEIKRTIKLLNQRTLSVKDYIKFGIFSYTTFIMKFGSWNKALEEACIDTKFHIVSEEQLIKNLLEVREKLGRNPKIKEMKKPLSQYSHDIYSNRFGTFTKALIKAGLLSKASKKELLKNLKELKVKLGRVPRIKDIKRPISRYSIKQYLKVFGSLNKALETINFIPTKSRNVTDEELINDLKKTEKKLKRTPTYRDIINHNSKFRMYTYKKKFGTWNKALERAGFKTYKSY